MSEEVQIQIVDGDEDDPFVQKTDPLDSADSSKGDDEDDGQDAGDDGLRQSCPFHRLARGNLGEGKTKIPNQDEILSSNHPPRNDPEHPQKS